MAKSIALRVAVRWACFLMGAGSRRVIGSRRGTLSRSIVVGLTLSAMMGGCVSMPSASETLKYWKGSAKSEGASYVLSGETSVRELADGLKRMYGIDLSYEESHGDDPVVLEGKYSLSDLSVALERQLRCESVVGGGRVALVWGSGQFQLPIPAVMSERDTLGGVRVENVSGRVFATGEHSELPHLREALRVLDSPRAHGRAVVVIVDEAAGRNGGLRFSEPFTIQWDNGLVYNWNPALVIDALGEESAIVRRFESIIVDGVDFAYEDVEERRFQQFTSGESGQVFDSTFSVVTAGLTLNLYPARLTHSWRLQGELELSDFRGGQDTPQRVARKVSIDVDATPGTMLRLATLRSERGRWSGGVQANAPFFLGENAFGEFSVWIALETIPVQFGGQRPDFQFNLDPENGTKAVPYSVPKKSEKRLDVGFEV
jgi:hypothetical protein